MPTRNINLTDHFDNFIASRVSAGRYGNASEIVREALRLLEQREQETDRKLQLLRAAARRGFDAIDQGAGIVLDNDRTMEELLADIAAKVKSRKTRKGRP